MIITSAAYQQYKSLLGLASVITLKKFFPSYGIMGVYRFLFFLFDHRCVSLLDGSANSSVCDI